MDKSSSEHVCQFEDVIKGLGKNVEAINKRLTDGDREFGTIKSQVGTIEKQVGRIYKVLIEGNGRPPMTDRVLATELEVEAVKRELARQEGESQELEKKTVQLGEKLWKLAILVVGGGTAGGAAAATVFRIFGVGG